MNKKKIAIIGGGASGLFVSILLALHGLDVTIFERNQRVGKKILTTGNGRCNLTNEHLSGNDYNHPVFVDDILSKFSVQETLDVFKTLGIETTILESGKYFPLSLQASSVVNAMLAEIERLHINVYTNTLIKHIDKLDSNYELIDQNQNTYVYDILILSTGGKAFPQTGSDGAGYHLATSLSHHLTDIRPSLVKLTIDSPYLKHLDGLKLNTKVSLVADGNIIDEEQGDVLFTSYGLSGPTILQLSKFALLALEKDQEVRIDIEVISNLTEEAIINRFYTIGYKTLEQSLNGLIHSRLIHPLVNTLGLDQHQLVSTLSYDELRHISLLLKHWKWKVIGSLDYNEAQVTSGGIDLNEVHLETLESKYNKNLYFTGEILDIDGRSGGYNLQWAWSSAGVVYKAIIKNHD